MIDNDRDYAAERIDDPIQQPVKIVPCHTCRCPVQVQARSSSIFDRTYCLRCTRSQYAEQGPRR